MSMAQKVALITGCSSGIGLDTAIMLAKDKFRRFKVFATMRNLTKQGKITTTAAAAGDTLLENTLYIRELDVNKEDDIVGFIERLNREEGGVDILINNAAVGQLGLFEHEPMEVIRRVFETNVFGLIRLVQAVIPNMKAKKSGHIINISSRAGLVGLPFSEIYSASKFAVEGFSESIAPLLRPYNISVSLIEPGPVSTSFPENRSANTTSVIYTTPTTDNPFGLRLNSTDEVLQQQFNGVMYGTAQRPPDEMQTGEDIAVVIKDAILSCKPHLHYPTSKSVTRLVAQKYKDTTGDSIVDMISGRIQEQYQRRGDRAGCKTGHVTTVPPRPRRKWLHTYMPCCALLQRMPMSYSISDTALGV